MKPGWFAPQVDAVTEDTATRRAPMAWHALTTARFKAGNDPEKDAATTSPRLMPFETSCVRNGAGPAR